MFCCVQIYLISPRTAFVFKTAKCQLRHYQCAQALAPVGRAAPGAQAAAAGVSSMSRSRTLLPPKQQVDDLQDPQYGQERLCRTAAAGGRWWSGAVRQQHRRAPGRVLLAAILSSLAARPRLALTQHCMSELPQTRLIVLISSRTALSQVCVPQRGAGPALWGLAAALCRTAGSLLLSPRPSDAGPQTRNSPRQPILRGKRQYQASLVGDFMSCWFSLSLQTFFALRILSLPVFSLRLSC